MVMLQSGIRAGMGIRVTGPDLATIQQVSLEIEKQLRQVPAIDPRTVIADRVIGKPYLEIHIDRHVIAQYGIRLQQVLDVIEFAIGGKQVTTTVEGREPCWCPPRTAPGSPWPKWPRSHMSAAPR